MNNQNPGAQPRNDSFDVITIFNPSDRPFEVFFNSELHAVIPSGQAIPLVKMIAGDSNYGAVKHLIDRMCRQQGVPISDPRARARWVSKVILSQKVGDMPIMPTPVDQARAINQSLQSQPLDVEVPTLPTSAQPVAPQADWLFDPKTGERLAPAKVGIKPEDIDTSHVVIAAAQGGVALPGTGAVALPPHPNPEADALLTGIRRTDDDGGRTIGEVPAEDAPPTPPTPTRTLTPTKEELITYANDVLMMNVNDPTTRLELEKQTVAQLMTTLNYDAYA